MLLGRFFLALARRLCLKWATGRTARRTRAGLPSLAGNAISSTVQLGFRPQGDQQRHEIHLHHWSKPLEGDRIRYVVARGMLKFEDAVR